MQEAAQQERFAPQNLQFPVAVQAQDIHLCKSISGKNGTNGQSCNAFLSGEHIVRDCMFHNQKNVGDRFLSVISPHLLHYQQAI